MANSSVFMTLIYLNQVLSGFPNLIIHMEND